MPNHTIDAEIEVKFTDVDLDDIRKRLSKAQATIKTPMRLMRRRVFGSEANEKMLCTYGRVRDEGDVITMSAKFSAVNNVIESQKEAQITVDSFENASAILDSFGLIATDYQENKRETWVLLDGTLVELEQWPDLPPYIEIEGKSVAALQEAALLLGLVWENHTTDSTDKLYGRHLNLSPEQVRERMSSLFFSKSE